MGGRSPSADAVPVRSLYTMRRSLSLSPPLSLSLSLCDARMQCPIALSMRDAPLSVIGICPPVCCLVSAPLSLCHLRGGSRALRVSNCKWVVIVITGQVGGAGQSAWDGDLS